MTAAIELSTVQARAREIAEEFAANRYERQRRTSLDRADFEALADAGVTLLPIPRDHGGLWESRAVSLRGVCEVLRTLGRGDPSVALVSSMHPAVISFWLIPHDPPEEHAAGWAEQRATIFQSAVEGHWWGTITSEPGSGGDIARTRTIAQQDGGPLNYRISGQKHFGSGSGVTSFMMTTAIPEDYGKPDLFYLDVREATWDGATGMKLTAPWDGHGMIATQSHGFMFENFPATRIAWPGVLDPAAAVAGGGACLFSAVILGIVDSAMRQGTADVQRRGGAMNAYEQMEWTRALSEAWLCDQAFEGMLRAIEESPTGTSVEALHGKAMIAELAETLLGRLCKIAGGGSFGRHSPYGFWFEDVRALGFLRPPWGLMYGAMVDAALAPEE